jgi:hypothetical protein
MKLGKPDTLLVYFGHHKCASTWIYSILDAASVDCGWRFAYLYDEKLFGHDLERYVTEHDLDFVAYTNADADFVRGLRPHRGFHVVRDPRDLLVSAYFSHKHSHPTHAWPELVAYRERLNAVSQEEGLLLEMDFSREVFAELAKWDYEQPHVLELKQEEIAPDPYRAFLEIFRFLGILDEEHFGKRRQWPFLLRACQNILYAKRGFPWRRPCAAIPAERLLGIVHDQRFSKKAGGRQAGQEDVKSHYRKGQAGDWINHFEPVHVERFKELYGDLLLRLGYEDSMDWMLARRG